MDGRVGVTVGLGVLGASLGVPFLWHFAMFGMYAWILLQDATSGTYAMPTDPVTLVLFGFFLAARLVGMLVCGLGGLAAVVGASRSLRGDESLLLRAAGLAAAAAALGFAGSLFTCDCLGGMVQLVPLVIAVVVGVLVSQRARELRDAAL